MKVIIAGSRSCVDKDIVNAAILKTVLLFKIEITEIVSGGARGVDKLGEAWAHQNRVPVKVFLADWARYGKSAGPIRNKQMAKYADVLIAIWDGSSKGTKNMIKEAEDLGLIVHVHII